MQKWNENLWLFTIEEFNQLPSGIVLTCIDGSKVIKDIDYVDLDVRFNHIAYGVENPLVHPESELFIKFKLS